MSQLKVTRNGLFCLVAVIKFDARARQRSEIYNPALTTFGHTSCACQQCPYTTNTCTQPPAIQTHILLHISTHNLQTSCHSFKSNTHSENLLHANSSTLFPPLQIIPTKWRHSIWRQSGVLKEMCSSITLFQASKKNDNY